MVTSLRVDQGDAANVYEQVYCARGEMENRIIPMESGVPSHHAFGRVFSRLDTAEFLAAMHNWVDEFCGSLRNKGIAIDGKTLRGSFDRTVHGQSLK